MRLVAGRWTWAEVGRAVGLTLGLLAVAVEFGFIVWVYLFSGR